MTHREGPLFVLQPWLGLFLEQSLQLGPVCSLRGTLGSLVGLTLERKEGLMRCSPSPIHPSVFHLQISDPLLSVVQLQGPSLDPGSKRK